MAETTIHHLDKYSSKDEESELIPQAQTSLTGFQQLYLHWLSPVYRYFFFRTGNSKDAEDLTSQVFLKVYMELPRYHERGLFSAWLFRIVHNQINDYYRTGSREVDLEIADPVDDDHDLITQTAHSDEVQKLRRIIQSLPEEEQEMIRLRFVAELGYREIGSVLNRNEDAVRKSITRLLARMKYQLEVNHE